MLLDLLREFTQVQLLTITSKLTDNNGILLEGIEREINGTLAFWKKFRNGEYTTAIINDGKITKKLDIVSTFAKTMHTRKKLLLDCEDEDESSHMCVSR